MRALIGSTPPALAWLACMGAVACGSSPSSQLETLCTIAAEHQTRPYPTAVDRASAIVMSFAATEPTGGVGVAMGAMTNCPMRDKYSCLQRELDASADVRSWSCAPLEAAFDAAAVEVTAREAAARLSVLAAHSPQASAQPRALGSREPAVADLPGTSEPASAGAEVTTPSVASSVSAPTDRVHGTTPPAANGTAGPAGDPPTLHAGGAMGGPTGYGGVLSAPAREVLAPLPEPGNAPDGIAVQGSLSEQVIEGVIRSHISEVQACRDRALSRRTELGGIVSVSFVISATGAVQTAVVGTTTAGDPPTEACITSAVRRWTFPPPDGGGVVVVNYAFELGASTVARARI